MRAIAPLVALLLAPLALASEPVHERNVAFLRSLVEADLATPATMPDGRVVPLAQALDEAAARAGAVDLAAIAGGAGPPPGFPQHIGDVWVLESGLGACEPIDTGIRVPFSFYPDAQMWIYNGTISSLSTEHGFYTFIIGWTSKTFELAFDSNGFRVTGDSDLYCIQYADSHLAFPFSDGVAWLRGE